jgi:hypothetical protein
MRSDRSLDAGDRHRPALGLRFRTLWHAPDLDRALAAGTDPLASDELTLRAQQLVEPDCRLRFALRIEEIVRDARLAQPAFVRSPVDANRSLLLKLAERLRADGPHPLRGLAAVDLLLREDDSPLFATAEAERLRDSVLAILAALSAGLRALR